MKVFAKNKTYYQLKIDESIGCYLFIFDSEGKCINDYLQDNIEQAEVFAEEEYKINRNNWITLSEGKIDLKITRKTIQEIIELWQIKILTNEEIYNWANSIYLQDEYDVDDWESDEGTKNSSVTNEIIALFDTMDMNLISEFDIKPIKEFAYTKIGNFKTGYNKLETYLKQRNIQEIQNNLKAIELYRNFT